MEPSTAVVTDLIGKSRNQVWGSMRGSLVSVGDTVRWCSSLENDMVAPLNGVSPLTFFNLNLQYKSNILAFIMPDIFFLPLKKN